MTASTGPRTAVQDDVVHHAELVAAYRARDAARAKRLILQHRDPVEELARRLITDTGGEV